MDKAKNMKKCIIFGAGYYGQGACYKLIQYYEILYYADNNAKLWGTEINGIKVISPEQLADKFRQANVDIIICSKSYHEMANQLSRIGIDEYYVMMEGFLYHCNKVETIMPVTLCRTTYYVKENKREKNIMFVQNTACIRTHKIALVMKNRGYKVFLLYTISPPVEHYKIYESVYDGIFTVFTMNELLDFVKNSEFDLIHSSNEPDFLTNILIQSGKKVVFDVHDTMSIRSQVDMDEMTLEFIANKKSHGVIYTSKQMADLAEKRYQIEKNKIFVLENLPQRQENIEKRYEKLSAVDHEIHCVYEGGINGLDCKNHRFFEEIWKKIVCLGIHIHFYSQQNNDYCKKFETMSSYLHYEGSMDSKRLISEMTKYDCGLLIFNVNDSNRIFLESASQNKMFEYINSGLPVLVDKLNTHIKFVERYGVGKYLDLDGDIRQQIKAVCKIRIPDNFLQDNALTMESKGDGLENFYLRIMTEE